MDGFFRLCLTHRRAPHRDGMPAVRSDHDSLLVGEDHTVGNDTNEEVSWALVASTHDCDSQSKKLGAFMK